MDSDRYIAIKVKTMAVTMMASAIFCLAYEAIGETLSLAMYYPAPVGVYKRLTTAQETVLTRDSGNAVLLGDANSGGMVGIGTTIPTVRLDVSGSGSFAGNISAVGALSATSGAFPGGIQVGNDTTTCIPAKAGAVRWNGTSLQFCDGGAWKSLVVGAS